MKKSAGNLGRRRKSIYKKLNLFYFLLCCTSIWVFGPTHSPDPRKQIRPRQLGESLSMLENCRIIIIGGVPLTDIGGGQRSAQLAHSFQRSLCEVQHLHIFGEVQAQSPRANKLNSLLTDLPLQTRNARSFMREGRRVNLLVVEVPHESAIAWVQMARQLGTISITVEVIDDWRHKSLGSSWYRPDVLHELCLHADTVTVTARALKPLLKEVDANRAILLPNAASEWTFKPKALAESIPQVPDIIGRLRGARFVLYFGSIYGSWFSWSHIIQTAKDCPETYIVIIGHASDEVRTSVETFKNIIFVETIQRELLGDYIYYADAAIIPFVPPELYDTISPVKVYEYAFSGKKIISTPSEAIEGIPGVHFASSEKEFAKLVCDPHLPSPTISETVNFMLKNSWSQRAQTMLSNSGMDIVTSYAVTVVTLAHNNADMIPTFINSLALSVSSGVRDFVIIIADTASTDNLKELIIEIQKRYTFDIHITYVRSGGASSGRQQAMKVRRKIHQSCLKRERNNCTDPDGRDHLWVFLDSDQFSSSSSWLREASLLLKAHRGKLGAIGWAAGWVYKSRGDDTIYWKPRRGENIDVDVVGVRTDISYLGSGGFVVPGDVALEAGGWDSQFDPHGYEDTDFSFAIRSKGYLLGYRRLSGIIHLAHSTTSKVSVNASSASKLLLQQHTKFINKWGHTGLLGP